MDAETLQSVLADYDLRRRLFEDYAEEIKQILTKLLRESGLRIKEIQYRVKERSSLANKLSEAERGYGSLADVTDIVGLRVVTFFEDDVREVAKIVRQHFHLDRSNFVDKSQTLNSNEFGYLSLHYVVSFDQPHANLTENRRFVGVKAEIQIRSLLQHAWAEIEHDLGYKPQQFVPVSLKRRFTRIAGLLEIADLEFSQVRAQALRLAEIQQPVVRWEGLTELLPQFVLGLPRAVVPPPKTWDEGELALFLNANVTNRLIEPLTKSTTLTEVSLSVEGASPRGPFLGRMAGVNKIIFPNVLPALGTVSDRVISVHVEGLRVNANQFGLRQDRVTSIQASLAIFDLASGRAIPLGDIKDIARVESGLEFWIENATCGSPEAPVVIIRDPAVGRRVLDDWNASAAVADLLLCFREEFHGAFRTMEEESGPDQLQCRAGTILLATFVGIPSGVHLFATVSDVHGSGTARMISTDSIGNKHADTVQALNGRTKTGLEFAPISLTNGTGVVAWEWVGAPTRNARAQAAFGVFVVPTVDIDIVERPVRVTAALGPLSNIGTASDIGALPRFAPTSESQNAFTVCSITKSLISGKEGEVVEENPCSTPDRTL